MKRFAAAVLAAGCAACSIDAGRGSVGVYQVTASAGSGGAEPVAQPSFFLTTYLRDFKKFDANDPSTNPAFGTGPSEDGAVEELLGADGKPVYRTPATPQVTHGATYFNQWYRDVPGTNFTVVFPLPMSLQPDGSYEYDSQKSGQSDVLRGEPRRIFCPIDDGSPYQTPFGNQGASHNFAFTAELHTTFVATPGSSVQVRADDDIYVFIDGKLVVDLGGTHVALEEVVSLDDLALTSGQPYPLDIFYAERMGGTGELTVRTNLKLTSATAP